MAEKKLEVKDLTISFRTSAGKVQAVRKISFDLYKGETLAIVGESGSGKSVTSKAIIGILAGNSIVEDGEILYDGQDLLKISEDDFHQLRGNKISMIFQDPMSSLNPIVKIGKQLTEAMVLKGRSRQRESRKQFNSKLALLEKNMIAATTSDDNQAQCKKLCKDFNTLESAAIRHEMAFNQAIDNANTLANEIPAMLFEIEHKSVTEPKARLKEVMKYAAGMKDKYVVFARMNEVEEAIEAIKANMSVALKNNKLEGNARTKAKADVNNDLCLMVEPLNKILEIAKEALGFTKPNFSAMGYYEKFINKEIPDMPVEQLNEELTSAFDNGFHYEFKEKCQKALEYAFKESAKNKFDAKAVLLKYRPLFEQEDLNKEEVSNAQKEIDAACENAINYLELKKSSREYTFVSSFNELLKRYFSGEKRNLKEQKRFDKETAKINHIIAKGKVPEWKPVPPSLVDFALLRKNILNLIDNLISTYDEKIQAEPTNDYSRLTEELIEFLKENASGVVNKVTKNMARIRAIKVMEEVGIPEARKRYYQYPFEFSGGMRQRIVIAIALVSNPDILICDEPTTALDVTIQANILELINKLKQERNLSIIFITHDLGVVANMADHVAVMYAGKIVEYGTSTDIFYNSAHPYTWALLSSIPDLETSDGRLEAIPGTPPNMIYPPVGDAFAERNKYAMQIDFEQQPPLFEVSEGHYAATWLLHPYAPKVTPPKAVLNRAERYRKSKEEEANE